MWDVAIVYGSFAVALITVGACAQRAGMPSNSTVGPPSYSIDKSWSTNLAVFGVLFGTFFSAKIVTTPKYVLDPGYALLSVLFALLALIAPIVFVALSDVKLVYKSGSAIPEIQSQGNASAFLITMLVTLWAALGQLATLGTLTAEVINAHKVADVTAILFLILIAAAAAVVGNALRTSKPLLQQQQLAFHALTKGSNDAMPPWSLL